MSRRILWNPWDWSGNTNANIYIGFGTNNGLTAEMIAAYPGFFSEDVGGYLMRNARWMMDTTKADGFRLDAVKHVPYYFFLSVHG
jgi:1,4-alpha-glucan branching enzyme